MSVEAEASNCIVSGAAPLDGAAVNDANDGEFRVGHIQPRSFIARPECQIFCMCRIRSSSKNIT